ncbi:MAG: hypothetical protein ABUS56_09410 [Acidobacteriota bacterium]
MLSFLRRHALLLLTATALALRLAGSGFGAPAHVHPDEVQYMPTALGMAADRVLVARDYHNPHLLTNLCFVIIGGLFGLLKIVGITPDVDAYRGFVWTHTFVFLLLARWLSAAGARPRWRWSTG